jgi:integrase
MILAECPVCHKKQAARNKICGGKSGCGEDLVKAKRSRKVRYWIKYRLPGGKQRKEFVSYSIEEARDADGKRRSQKRENRIFDIKPEAKITFQELTNWYLGLEAVKTISSFWRIQGALKKFNSEFGSMVVSKIKPIDLQNYQAKRKAEGLADATIDREIGEARTMIYKAFDNDAVGGETLRTFKKVRKLLKKKTANARDRILTLFEFESLMIHLPLHVKGIFAIGFHTGMRLDEILSLTWDKVDLGAGFIRLNAEDTKDREKRNIPISKPLEAILKDIPKALHENHVFLYQGKPIKSVKKSLKTACERAGILYGRFVKGGFIFHDLRHTFNTNMRKAGVPESVIMKITGHSTREMFDRYNTIDQEDMSQGMIQFELYLASGPQNGPQKTEKG